LAVYDVNFKGVSYGGLGPFRVGVEGTDRDPLFAPVHREFITRNPDVKKESRGRLEEFVAK